MLTLSTMTWAATNKELADLLAYPARLVSGESEMKALGIQLAGILPAGILMTLSGELGAGKSVLARSLIHALGFAGRVKSPTYTLVETYDIATASGAIRSVAHLDLYRLEDPAELDYLGFDEIIQNNQLVLIEWPEKGRQRIPRPDLHISIQYGTEDERLVEFSIPEARMADGP